jgi:predicted anti-sigma-YlaC factor YlaD
MRISASALLALIAVVLFLLAAFAVQVGTLDLVTLGLAAFAAAFLAERLKR